VTLPAGCPAGTIQDLFCQRPEVTPFGVGDVVLTRSPLAQTARARISPP